MSTPLAGYPRLAPEAQALERLAELTSQLWRADSLAEGLVLILSASIELVGADMGSVRLLDGDGKVMRLAAQRGFSAAFLDRFGALTIPIDSEWGRAARDRVVVEDVETDPHFAPFQDIARTAGYRALQSTPMFGRDGAFVGILLTHFRAPSRPSDEELKSLELYAGWAAAFIERCRDEARLREGERRHAFLVELNDALRDLTDPLAIQEAAASLLGPRLGVGRAHYAEVVDERELVIHQDFVNGMPSIAGRYPLAAFGEETMGPARLGQNVIVHDVESDPRTSPSALETYRANGTRAYMCANLVKEGRLVGALCVDSASPRVWTPFEIELLSETAERTWAAVERAHADLRLRDNEARMRLVLDASQATSWSWCGTTAQAIWDERFHAQYGFAAETRPTLDAWLGRIHEEDRRRVEARIAELRAGEGGDGWDIEFRALRPDGTTVCFHSMGRAKREADGQLHSVVGIQLDVTARKRAEAELRAVSERLATIHDNAPFGILVTRAADGRFLSVNGEFTRIFGWSREEVEGRTSLELGMWTPEQRERVVAPVRAGGAVHDQEVTVRTKTGAERVVATNIVPLEVNGVDCLLGAIRDITEEKRVQAQLDAHRSREREQSEIMRTLLATTAQGILSVDRHGVIVQANAALEAMLGWGPGELAGQTLAHVLPAETRRAHMSRFLEFWAGPRTSTLEVPEDIYALRKDGTTVPVEASVTYVPTADGGRLFAFVTEVSERRRTQRALDTYTRELEYRAHQLRRLASALTLAEQHASERLALRLHGNLQQLLASGQSTLDLLARRVAHRAESETPLFDLLKRSLDEAVAETRALAREVFPQRLHHDGLAEGLRWQAGWFREKLGLNVDLTWDPAADPDRRDVRALLFESVRELLFNAAKHGRVQRVTVRLELTQDDQIRIEVADEGVGFDPAVAFGHRDERKTGLGLFSISERIALIGGSLDVQSAPRAGARFTIRVPRASDEPYLEERPTLGQARTREPAPPRPDVLPLSVLIVDDHALVRHGLRLLFESHPELRIVGEASSGVEAVAQARALRPDAIVMDVSMPEMDGVEATRQIVGEFPEITILGLSAQERTSEAHAIEQAGAAGFFTKGPDGDLLIGHLLALHERAAAAAQRTS